MSEYKVVLLTAAGSPQLPGCGGRSVEMWRRHSIWNGDFPTKAPASGPQHQCEYICSVPFGSCQTTRLYCCRNLCLDHHPPDDVIQLTVNLQPLLSACTLEPRCFRNSTESCRPVYFQPYRLILTKQVTSPLMFPNSSCLRSLLGRDFSRSPSRLAIPPKGPTTDPQWVPVWPAPQSFL
jgi:hypothetical protein